MFKRLLLAALFTVPACGAVLAAEYHQAPALDALVSSGKLPPVAQRLPDAPEVVKPRPVGRALRRHACARRCAATPTTTPSCEWSATRG